MLKKLSGNGVAAPSGVDATDGAATRGEATPAETQAHLDESSGERAGTRKPLKLSTVSHTLDAEIAERLRHFAFRERISESAVIEFSLRAFFEGRTDATLGQELRERGAGLRRKS